MAKQIQWRRGTESEHATFTGAVGEVTVNTTDDRLVVHDGTTQGGHPAAKESEITSKIEKVSTATSGNFASFNTSGSIQDSNYNVSSFVVPTNNLSELTSASLARNNLGLGTSAPLDVGTSSGTVSAGDHAHASLSLTVVDEVLDGTCYPIFTNTATGDVTPKTNLNLGFNAVTGILSASGFNGNATSATILETPRTINGISFDGSSNIVITSGATEALTRGNYLTGSDYDGTTPVTWAVDVGTGATQVSQGDHNHDTAYLGITDSAISATTVTAAAQPTITSVGTLTTLTVDNININGNTIISTNTDGNITLTPDGVGDVTVTKDLIVGGDFTVNGTTTTISTTNTTVEDSLVEFSNGTTGSPINDSGVIVERGDSDNVFFGWDETTDEFTAGTGTFTGASTGNLTTTDANVRFGNISGTQLSLGDNQFLYVGTGNDMRIYHDGSGSTIDNSIGNLNLRGKSGENSIVCVPDGAVNLYYDNAPKFATTSTGINVTGTITTDGLSIDENLPSIQPALNLNFADSGTIDPRITTVRATTATYVGADGLIHTAAVNEPRIGYDPTTLECLGLLVEEARTNFFNYSEQFDNAAWTQGGGTITADSTTAPDGELTADKYVEDGTTTQHFAARQTVDNGSTIAVVSVFVKYIGRQWVNLDIGVANGGVYFDIQNGIKGTVQSAVVDSGITQHVNGWYRIWVVASVSGSINYHLNSASGDGVSVASVVGINSDAFYLWGAQIEAGAFPTSYIPTVAAQVTRNADVPSVSVSDFPYSTREGTILVRYKQNTFDASQYPFSLDDETNNNRITAYTSSLTTTSVLVVTSGSTVVSVSAVSGTSGTEHRLALSYAEDDFAASNDGGTVVTDSAGALPTVTTLHIGCRADSASQINGHIKYLSYYPIALTDTEIQALTEA